MNRARVSSEALQAFVTRLFVSQGVEPGRAADAAEVLLYADAAGLSTHGVVNLVPLYLAPLKKGEIAPNARPTVVRRSGGAIAMDAHNTLGLLAGRDALALGVEAAEAHGISAVTVRRSNHFGAAGFYAGLALASGKIAIAMTNLGSQAVARAPGSQRNNLGTNPIAFAAPTSDGSPFVLDMSTTVCASGKIKEKYRDQAAAPAGWLVDAHGQTVEEPAAYLDGKAFLPPLGGWRKETGAHKGLGLNLMVEVLCGLLAEADVPMSPPRESRNSIGHFFLVLDPSRWTDAAVFGGRLAQMGAAFLQEPVYEGYEQLKCPGYPEWRHMQDSQRVGIELPGYLIADLNAFADGAGVPSLAGVVSC